MICRERERGLGFMWRKLFLNTRRRRYCSLAKKKRSRIKFQFHDRFGLWFWYGLGDMFLLEPSKDLDGSEKSIRMR